MYYQPTIKAIDLFCGTGGLTYGLKKAGIDVTLGFDIDPDCKYSYEQNNNVPMKISDVNTVDPKEIKKHWKGADYTLLAGCAPCQPFSTHTNKYGDRSSDRKWGLLYSFARLIKETEPDFVTMENVAPLEKEEIFHNFLNTLEEMKYHVFYKTVFLPDYGVPQTRRRLVLLASKFGKIELIPPTHEKDNYPTVRQFLGSLPPIQAGETDTKDTLHRSRDLSSINLERIRNSKPGGTWEDWPESLLNECHKKESGRTYSAVYGRMQWDEPGPTITTQFFTYGTGRFGHPEQDRALSLREGALLQSFPINYKFYDLEKPLSIDRVGKLIGNAVPPELGKIIGVSIINSLEGNENATT